MDPRTARALGSGTRAAIYQRLRDAEEARTVSDVAEEFSLHPNVARTHLEKLAELGLARVGQRKQPGGGRPAKIYEATDPPAPAPAAATADARSDDPSVALLVRLLAELAERPATRGGPPHPLARAHEVAAAEGRRLAGEAAPEAGGFVERVEAAVRALAEAIPGARMVSPPPSPPPPGHTGGRRAPPAPERAGASPEPAGAADTVDVAGVDGAFRLLAVTRPRLARALERGLLSGALTEVGAPASIGELSGSPGRLRVRPAAAMASGEPSARVDARGLERDAAVARVRGVVGELQPGHVVEVLVEGPGAPAAFARWLDRAGHQLLSVERVEGDQGRSAIRLLLRCGG